MALRLPFRHVALRCYFDAILLLYNYRTLITRPLPMKLPFAHRLRVDESKIVEYLLSQLSGQGKAAFFLGFGFRPEKWMALADALRTQARRNLVVAQVDSSTVHATVSMVSWNRPMEGIQEYGLFGLSSVIPMSLG